MSSGLPIADEEPVLSLVCPKCGAYMEEVEFGGITVDRCTNCAGLWFDYREAESLRDVPGADEHVDVGDPQIGRMLDVIEHIRCPRCDVPMERITSDQQPNLHFESCPRCYGIFLDAGEFHDFSHTSLVEWIVRVWFFPRP